MKIELVHVRKEYENITPITDVNAVVNEGDVVSIIGPSGCGKSTILRAINMIEPPTSGKILIDGDDITDKKCNLRKIRQKVGMVFQGYDLFEHLTVLENVTLPLTDVKHLSEQAAYDIAIEKLSSVGLLEKLHFYPNQLSGGQRQRASIARTLAMNPDVLLLDEPTSALDPTNVREVESVIQKLARSGKTMIVVTHEMRLAKAISNRIFYIDQGILYEEGTPDEIFNHPKRERTKAFVNNLKVFKYKFLSGSFDYEDFNTKLQNFANNNLSSLEKFENVQHFYTWFATDFLPEHMDKNLKFDILVEYAEDQEILKTVLYAEAKDEDKTCMKEKLVSQLKLYDANGTAEYIDDPDYNIKSAGVLYKG